MFRNPIGNVFIVMLLMFGAKNAQADWLRFRGPNGSGISQDKAKLPQQWSSSTNLKWKTKLPGAGVSSPIIVGDRVFVTCYSGYGLDVKSPGDQKNLKRHLVCIDRSTGHTMWDRVVDAVLPEDPYAGIGVPAHGYASNVPVSDGENIYVFFGKTGVLAFDKEGHQLWRTSVGRESDPRHWGSAASLTLYKNLLIVPAMAESEALVALDKKTGKEVWRQEAKGFASSWSTPILVRVNDTRSDLVIGVTQEIWGLNPESGKLRWYSEGAKARSFCSSPVSDGDMVYAIEGQTGVSIAVRAGGAGDVTKTHVLWTGRDSGRFSSPIVRHGRIYSFANGVVNIIDTATGQRLDRVRLKGDRGESGGSDFASPIFADGKFYMVRRSGDTYVLRGEDKLETLSVNRVTDEAEEFSATPAVSDGELYIRSNKHLYCVALTGQGVSKNLMASTNDTKEIRGTNNVPAQRSDAHDGGEGSHQQRRRPRGGHGGSFNPAAMFKRRDVNKDGKLSGEELSGHMRSGMEQLDSDKDGALTLEEFRSGMRKLFGGHGRGGHDGSSREGKPDRPQRPQMES